MSDQLVRFTVSLEADLLEAFDRYIAEQKVATRSEAIGQLLREALTAREWVAGAGDAAATLTIVYDHHRTSLMEKLPEGMRAGMISAFLSVPANLADIYKTTSGLLNGALALGTNQLAVFGAASGVPPGIQQDMEHTHAAVVSHLAGGQLALPEGKADCSQHRRQQHKLYCDDRMGDDAEARVQEDARGQYQRCDEDRLHQHDVVTDRRIFPFALIQARHRKRDGADRHENDRKDDQRPCCLRLDDEDLRAEAKPACQHEREGAQQKVQRKEAPIADRGLENR